MQNYINYDSGLLKYPGQNPHHEHNIDDARLNFITEKILSKFFNNDNLSSSRYSSVVELSPHCSKLAFYYEDQEYLLYFINNYDLKNNSNEQILRFISQFDDLDQRDILGIQILQNTEKLSPNEAFILLKTIGQTVCYNLSLGSESNGPGGKFIKLGYKLQEFISQNFINQYLSGNPSDFKFDRYIIFVGPDSWRLKFTYQKDIFYLFGFDHLTFDDDTEVRIKQIIKSYDEELASFNFTCLKTKQKYRWFDYIYYMPQTDNKYLSICSDSVFLIKVI